MESAQDFIARKNTEFAEFKKSSKTLRFKDIGREGTMHFKREAWTLMEQSNVPEKVFVIERLEREGFEGKKAHPSLQCGDIEYRIGYYIVGKNGRKKNKWVWGQYCPLIPSKDLKRLFKKAEKQGTIKRYHSIHPCGKPQGILQRLS